MGIRLLHTVGKPYVDGLLADIVHQYESSFPNRVRSYFLLGSYADGCAVVGSDIDVYVLFKETFLSRRRLYKHNNLPLLV